MSKAEGQWPRSKGVLPKPIPKGWVCKAYPLSSTPRPLPPRPHIALVGLAVEFAVPRAPRTGYGLRAAQRTSDRRRHAFTLSIAIGGAKWIPLGSAARRGPGAHWTTAGNRDSDRSRRSHSGPFSVHTMRATAVAQRIGHDCLSDRVWQTSAIVRDCIRSASAAAARIDPSRSILLRWNSKIDRILSWYIFRAVGRVPYRSSVPVHSSRMCCQLTRCHRVRRSRPRCAGLANRSAKTRKNAARSS